MCYGDEGGGIAYSLISHFHEGLCFLSFISFQKLMFLNVLQVRYLVAEEDCDRAALALQITNLLVRAYFASR